MRRSPDWLPARLRLPSVRREPSGIHGCLHRGSRSTPDRADGQDGSLHPNLAQPFSTLRPTPCAYKISSLPYHAHLARLLPRAHPVSAVFVSGSMNRHAPSRKEICHETPLYRPVPHGCPVHRCPQPVPQQPQSPHRLLRNSMLLPRLRRLLQRRLPKGLLRQRLLRRQRLLLTNRSPATRCRQRRNRE
jgi:hypothetical protein